MNRPFLVKLPVFKLQDGRRGILTAAIGASPISSKAHLFCDDGTYVTMVMDNQRLLQAQMNGPWVFLAEVKEPGGDLQGDAKIIIPGAAT